MTHKCPKQGCNQQIPQHMLACKRHWFEVPKPLRDAIWQTYRSGDKAAHSVNVREAMRLLGEKK